MNVMRSVVDKVWQRLIWKYLPSEERVIHLRKNGLDSIRTEAVKRAKSELKPATIEARWEDELSRIASPMVEDQSHRLNLFLGGIHITGYFPDWAVVLYPHDAQSVARVEHELQYLVSALHVNATKPKAS